MEIFEFGYLNDFKLNKKQIKIIRNNINQELNENFFGFKQYKKNHDVQLIFVIGILTKYCECNLNEEREKIQSVIEKIINFYMEEFEK